jgi:hypothetical protein
MAFKEQYLTGSDPDRKYKIITEVFLNIGNSKAYFIIAHFSHWQH